MDAHGTIIFHAFLVAAAIIGCILTFLFATIVRLHRRHMRENRSQAAKELLLLEKERVRIAIDLHDELGPILSAAKFRISAIEAHDDEQDRLIESANSYIDTIVIKVRAIANDLMPASILRKGPAPAIRNLVATFQRSGPPHIQFDCVVDVDYTGDTSIHIYRIAQELLNNAVRHAKANMITISIESKANALLLKCQDDGVGFDKKIVEGKGIGLWNVMRRSEMLNAELFIESQAGRGSIIEVLIPLQSN